jgi:hypothetical protein
MSFLSFSTGTKSPPKTPTKFKKVSVLDLVPVQRVQKQSKISFSKNRQYVFSTRCQL